MDFEKICKTIDKGTSLKVHKYYQKIIVFLFLHNHDPFGRQLKGLSVEKKYKKGVADIFARWEYQDKKFSEIIEIEIAPKKKTIQEKISLYSKKADLFSICIPSKKVQGLIKIFSLMKKDLPNIKMVYVMHDKQITKNNRKIVDDKNILIGAYSPFMLATCPDGDLNCIIRNAGLNKEIFFNALLREYLK